jgi:hypothetical protein
MLNFSIILQLYYKPSAKSTKQNGKAYNTAGKKRGDKSLIAKSVTSKKQNKIFLLLSETVWIWAVL